MDLKTLRERQSWTLEQKIDHSLGAIDQFVREMGGVDKVFVSFSGGKDSCVLLHLVERIYPNVVAVFINTGNELPDNVKFVNQKKKLMGERLVKIRPGVTPREIWEREGFPLISKDVASRINLCRRKPECKTAKFYIQERLPKSMPLKYRYLLDEPYSVSARCCYYLKKRPSKIYQNKTGRKPILGTMASESQLRERAYLTRGGCNALVNKNPSSHPLSIWNEEDIWEYIRRFNVPISEAYAKGYERTGCMGCGFGIGQKGDRRYELLKEYYPKCYDMVMKYTNNGVTFKEAADKIIALQGKRMSWNQYQVWKKEREGDDK